MTLDEAREYVVIVNEGSGCIFQPANPEETYILTAKHNIENADNQINQLIRFKFENNIPELIEVEIDQLVVRENYFPHPNKDIAIIKVERIPELDKSFIFKNLEGNQKKLKLLGYPQTRRDANPENKIDWFRANENVSILNSLANGRKEAEIPGNPARIEMLGHSGGAICKISGDDFFIAGIQNSLIRATDEQLGRIEFTPISEFDEIIEEYDLSGLYPYYLSNFSFLKDKAFDLGAGFDKENIEHVKNFLRKKAQEVTQSDITPLGIKDFFKESLLIHLGPSEDLQCEIIWVVWLEFLTIMNIVKEKEHTEEELSELFNSHRLICSNSPEDWARQWKSIIQSDFRGLRSNGTVLVGIKKAPENDHYKINKTIPFIKRVATEVHPDKIHIDEGLGHPLNEFTFIHMDYFKNGCISKRHSEYVDITDEDELLKKLMDVYNEIF